VIFCDNSKSNSQHPAEKEIDEWVIGRKDGIIEEWNRRYMDKMM